jgi:hypothetical protein
MDRTGSESCRGADFSVSGVEHSGYATIVSVTPEFRLDGLRKTFKIAVRIAVLLAESRARNLPTTNDCTMTLDPACVWHAASIKR